MNETRITAKGIMEDADKLINQVCKSQFPVEIFPTMIRKIIWKMKEALTYPVDYTALFQRQRVERSTFSLLAVSSTLKYTSGLFSRFSNRRLTAF